MASDVEHWRYEGELKALERLSKEEDQARYEEAQCEERYRFKPWDPFGKPGGGAPASDSNKRRRGFGYASNSFEAIPPGKEKVPISEGFGDFRKPVNRKQYISMSAQDDFDNRGFHDFFGQPGGGAPLRTESGHVITGKMSHDDLVMQANIVGKKTFLNAVPPVHRDIERMDRYKKDLDSQHFTKVVRLMEDRSREKKLEQQSGGTFDFGEKEKRGDPLQGRRKLVAHLHPEDNLPSYPWGSSNNQPERDADGNVKRHKHSIVNNGLVQLFGSTEESSEHIKELEKVSKKRDTNMNLIADQYGNMLYDVKASNKAVLYDPFGKPGAGAPRRDERGNILTRMPKSEIHDPIADKQRNWSNKVYLDQIKQAMKEHDMVKGEWAEFDKMGCSNFADIVDRSLVGKVRRNNVTGFIEGQPLSSTEITNPGIIETSLEAIVPVRNKYHGDLQKQVEDKERRGVLDQIRERQEANQHYDTQNRFWGRRGVGAGTLAQKRHLADEGSSNIYEAFTSETDVYSPRKTGNTKHSTVARIQHASDKDAPQNNSKAEKPADATTDRRAYLTDTLYVPGGGLGYYGADLLQQINQPQQRQPAAGNTDYGQSTDTQNPQMRTMAGQAQPTQYQANAASQGRQLYGNNDTYPAARASNQMPAQRQGQRQLHNNNDTFPMARTNNNQAAGTNHNSRAIHDNNSVFPTPASYDNGQRQKARTHDNSETVAQAPRRGGVAFVVH